METRSELEKRADGPTDRQPAAGRLEDARQQSKQSRLARAVATNEPDRFPRLNSERDVAERPDLAPRHLAPTDQRLAQRNDRFVPDPKAAADPLDSYLSGSHTAQGYSTARGAPGL